MQHAKRVTLSKKMKAAFLATAIAATGVGAVALTINANASVPAPTKGFVTVLPSSPRIVGSPGQFLSADQTTTIDVGGQTFSGIAVPANATGVTVSITSIAPTAAGKLTVWTTETGRPGTGSVSFDTNEQSTNVVQVGLNSDGKLNVHSTVATRFVMALTAYYTPVPAPVQMSIAPSSKTLDQVGGPIRGNGADLKGYTDFGSVTLTPGTWDARIVGGWTGLNNSNSACSTGSTFLTGTMVVFTGDSIAADFSNVVATTGGVMIPESNSATLTQDPTALAAPFITVAADTKVHVGLFAYASNSSTECTGVLKGNLQSAKFQLN